MRDKAIKTTVNMVICGVLAYVMTSAYYRWAHLYPSLEWYVLYLLHAYLVLLVWTFRRVD